MQPLKHQKMTIKEYLALEESSEEKLEYSQGMVWAMSGATPDHALICANLIKAIGNLTDPLGCRIFGGDLRIRIEESDSFLRADASIVCGEPEYSNKDKNSLVNPEIIFEVLSHSTEGYDRGVKFHKYSLIPDLIQYVLISQDKPFIESFTRERGGRWSLDKSVGLNSDLEIPSKNLKIALREIYKFITNLKSPMYFSDQEE
ncbi:MAG: Uma2 family endonuclease [Bacteroidia bacterium]|nr:Uma2 family endonuclease [Bacteroidia bacterium]